MEDRDKQTYGTKVEELFRKHYKVLRAYAYRLINDRDMAEDIVQDIYVELWKKREQLLMESAIRFYLFRAVYTRSLNYLNSKQYTDQEPFEQTTEGRIQQIYLQTQALDQESELLYKELQGKIADAVSIMPEQCRKVFLLSRKHEMKNKEIADHLGISVKTVEKHISKALSVLREQLKDYGITLLLPLFF